MGRDDDRVRVEHVQRIHDRLHRVGVADEPRGRDAVGAQPLEAPPEPLLGRGARLVLVRHPVAQAGVQRGRDDQDAGTLR
jgi:hypothetical protein